jgi:hypothetical protein
MDPGKTIITLVMGFTQIEASRKKQQAHGAIAGRQ